ncbi:MAG: monovalent cation:proton antiporter-2 (CPA2) family protein [Rickettsiales bacterium]|nr:monovalent cation:proton antiporter-2 (CPA2) family protein [Rickettsiales bacterium]
MENGFLFSVFVFLMAACIMVPLAGRLKLGSVLGYLVAGVIIGPFGLSLIENPEAIMHFAEFGVVMMLFIIGLELEPEKLWSLRKAIIGLGGLQMALTTTALTLLGITLGYAFAPSLAVSLALSLSSTALVLQVLQERGLMNTAAGESSFAVLLFQDIAVIPILALMPLMGDGATEASNHGGWISSMPGWMHAEIVMAAICIIVLGGSKASRHVFRFIANTNLREVFTATSLALIVGITLLMDQIGLSPAMGAFIAGVVLANSEYKHTLEADIEPFKNLLLGLFFISVGMGMDFTLLAAHPLGMLGTLAALLVTKIVVLLVAGRFFGLKPAQNIVFAFVMSQGGEFAFVLFQYASTLNVLPASQSGFLTMAVALSMATTPFLIMFASRYVLPRFISILPAREDDHIPESNLVIIAGYGRFGQIVGRFMRAQDLSVTVLENSPDQIELIGKFGGQVFFGDASRLSLLQSARADKARLLVVAVDDADKALEITRMARANFPNLKIFARARNRRHAYELHRAGANYFVRETFHSALTMAQAVMVEMGYNAQDMAAKAEKFKDHDEATLHKSFEFYEQEPELLSFARQAREELKRILQNDEQATG